MLKKERTLKSYSRVEKQQMKRGKGKKSEWILKTKNELNIQKHSEFSYNTEVSIISFDAHVSCFTQYFHNVPVTRCEHMKRKAEDISILFSGLPLKKPPERNVNILVEQQEDASKCSQGKFKNFFKLNIKLQVVFGLHRSDVSSTQNHAHEQRVNKADLS